MKTSTLLVLVWILLAGCTQVTSQPTEEVLPETPTIQSSMESLPNPASVFCEQQGYTLEIRTAADGSQSGVCIFPDGSECDEWAYHRGECAPADQIQPLPTPTVEATSGVPTEIPTAVPIDPTYYQGFWTYTNPTYGFSLLVPFDWVVDETTTGDPLMNGHLLLFHPQDDVGSVSLRVTFRSIGEDTLLWPTGVGQGEFIDQGTLDVAGQPVRRILLVCPAGQVNSIWYHGGADQANIQRGNLEFGFIYSYTGGYCEDSYSLSGKVQLVGELVIASLTVP
jgi:putative hemolysin